MADIVKEIYNGTILYGNYTNSLQTLATTGANTTLVVKDVEVGTNTYTTNPELQVSGFNVGTLSGNLSGSEIIGTNSALKIKKNDSLTFSSLAINYVDNTSSSSRYYASTTPTSFVSPSTTTSTLTQGSSTLLNSMTTGSQVYGAWVVNGNLYYAFSDGNSSQGFYKVSGITGSQTALASGSYQPVCFDHVDKFYWVQSGYLYWYDATTNSTSNVYTGWNSGSTYPMIFFANGVVFWQYTTGDFIYWYKVSDGTQGNIGGTYTTWPHSSASNNPTVFYDASTYSYRVVAGTQVAGNTTSGYVYYDFTSNAGLTSFTNNTGYGSISTPSLAIKIGQRAPAGTYNYCFGSGSSATTLYRIDKNLTISTIASVTGASFGSYTVGNVVTSPASTAEINANGPQISLRITGVESTI